MRIDRREFIRSSAFVTGASFFSPDAGGDGRSPFRVGVIGHTGRGNYGHSLDTLWLTYPGCEIVCVADPDDTGLKKAMERLNVAKGYRDYREMLKTERPDIVSIALRHIDQHCEMAVSAANAGVKGIYLEKPFCRNLKEADEIIAACAANDTRLALAHHNRYHPAIGKALKLVEEGRLGKVLEIRARGKEDHRGGPLDLWVLGSHILNLVPVFTGAFTTCSASLLLDDSPVLKSHLYEGDEGVGLVGGNRLHARFGTRKGISVYYDCVKDAGVREGNFGFQILGVKGALDIRIGDEPVVMFSDSSPFFPPKGRRPEWVRVTGGGLGVDEPAANIRADIAGQHAAVRDLFEAVGTDGRTLCNEQDGRATVEAIMAVFESHRRGGAVVDFPVKALENPLQFL